MAELSPELRQMLAERRQRRLQAFADQARALGFEAEISKRGVTLIVRGTVLGTACKPMGWSRLLGRAHSMGAVS